MTGPALLAPRPRRGPNLTALIDVVFILLMFFMLTSSFTQWRSLTLQTAAQGAAATAPPPRLLVLFPDGRVAPVAERDRPQLLAPLLPELARGDAAVVILPLGDTAVQAVVGVFEQLAAAGIDRVTLGNALE